MRTFLKISILLSACLVACTQLPSANKNRVDSLNQQGIAYRQQGKFVEAEQAYQQALAIDDQYANAWLNLGILYDLYRPDAIKARQAYEKFQSLQATPDKDVAAWIKALSVAKQESLSKPEAP